MSGVLCADGLDIAADAIYTAFDSLHEMMLYTNTITPGVGTAYADLTEATYSGYARQTVDLSAPVLNVDTEEIDAAALTFTHDGGGVSNTVKGYAIVRTSDNKLIVAENLPTAKTMASSGDFVKVDGEWTVKQGT